MMEEGSNMSDQLVDIHESEHLEEKKSSTGKKIGCGCGCGCLVVIILVASLILSWFNKMTPFVGYERKIAETHHIAANQTTEGDTFFMSDSMHLEGNHIGNLSIVAGTIVIDGMVQGNVYCMGDSITINGTVDGNLYPAGEKLTINGTVTGNIEAVAIGHLDQFGIVEGEISGMIERIHEEAHE